MNAISRNQALKDAMPWKLFDRNDLMNMRAIRMVYLSCYWERRSMGSLWMTWMLLGLGVVAAAAHQLLNTSMPGAWRFSLAIFVGMSLSVVIIWLTQMSTNGLLQCTPHNITLTPRLHRSVLSAFRLAWFASTSIVSLLFAAAFGHFVLFFLGIGAALFLLLMAFSQRGWFYGVPIYLYGFYQPYLGGFARKTGLWDSRPMPNMIFIAAMFALVFLMSRRLFGLRGDKAYAAQVSIQNIRELMKAGGTKQPPSGTGKWISAYKIYDLSLKRSLAHKMSNAKERARRLLCFAMGYDMHWSSPLRLSISFILGGFVWIGFCYIWPTLHTEMNGGVSIFLCLPAITLVPTTLFSARNTLLLTRSEQIFLRLLPSLPQDAALNAIIGRMLLLQLSIALVCGIVVSFLAYWVFWNTGAFVAAEKHPEYILCAALATLPLFAFSATDFSAMKQPSKISLLSFSSVLPLAILLAILRSSKFPPMFFSIASALVPIISLTLLAWRWRQMMDSPCALPVGRMAK